MQASQSIRNCGYRHATRQVTALPLESHLVSRGPSQQQTVSLRLLDAAVLWSVHDLAGADAFAKVWTSLS